jgi:cardiolipin synthase
VPASPPEPAARTGAANPDPVNSFRVVVGAAAFVTALRAEARACRESLDVQFSTFEGDDSGQDFAQVLLECADRGVEVRLTVDHYSDVVLSDFHPLLVHRLPEMRQERVRTHALFDRLRDHSVGVRRTAPPGALGRYLLFRDHKKLVILDDRVAFVGGINVSDHNFGWHDLMVRIEGPLVADLAADYRSSWDGDTVALADARPDGDFVLNHNAARESVLEELMRMIAGARETLVIESPYLLGDRLEREIVRAAQRGVQVTLIVPDRANRGIVRLWRRRTLQRFQHPNIALLGYRATGGMLHAKFAIADGRRATFGSFNMFELESRTQKELNVFTDDPSLVEQLAQVVADDLAACEPIPRPSWSFGRFSYSLFFRFVDRWTRRLLRDPEWKATYC